MAQHYTAEDLQKYVGRAQKVNKYQGKQYYRVPVKVLFNSSRQCRTLAVKVVQVVAPSAAEAANYIRDEYSWRPETEVIAFGPRGGKVERYVGYESSIAFQLLAGAPPTSLSLSLEG